MLNKAGANLNIDENLKELQQEMLQKAAIGALVGGGKKGRGK
jgi:hypothetical protein